MLVQAKADLDDITLGHFTVTLKLFGVIPKLFDNTANIAHMAYMGMKPKPLSLGQQRLLPRLLFSSTQTYFTEVTIGTTVYYGWRIPRHMLRFDLRIAKHMETSNLSSPVCSRYTIEVKKYYTYGTKLLIFLMH